MSDREKSCEERIGAMLVEELATLRAVFRKYTSGHDDEWWDDLSKKFQREWREAHPDQDWDDTSRFPEYHLSFDYVEADTFDDLDEGFYRYQLSWGGPSDEFRFFFVEGAEPTHENIKRVEYRFMDWYDGAGRDLSGNDLELLTEIFKHLVLDQSYR